jgi:DNA-directed RNA polymerase subunit M/transcription elongation factor TFIIS
MAKKQPYIEVLPVQAVYPVHPVQTVHVDPVPDVPAAQPDRVYNTDTAVPCPRCKRNAALVVSTRKHPAFIETRFRRYKCRACGHPFKAAH